LRVMRPEALGHRPPILFLGAEHLADSR
jgi:hypothetical protein